MVESGFLSVFDLATLDGNIGFAIDGIEADDRIGSAVSEAGDINRDGFADLIIGAPLNEFRGGAYVVFGADARFSEPLSLADLTGDNGVFLEGTEAVIFTCCVGGFPFPINTPSSTGVSVDGIGDFNADGFDDLVIGAPGGSDGEALVVYGDEQFPAAIDLGEDLNGANGFEIFGGSDTGELLGLSTSGVGDINGDGIADVIVGAPGIEPEEGDAYVVFGTTDAFPVEFEVGLLDGRNGFRLAGTTAGEQVGQAVSGAGDVNGDGIDDLIVSAPSVENSALEPRSYVVFGSRDTFPSAIALADLSGEDGFAISGTVDGGAGEFVSGIGDINADGISDIAIGVPNADANGADSGQVYVIFGSRAGFPDELELADLNDQNGFAIAGLAAGDELGAVVSQAGDLNADGIDDFVIGAALADGNGADAGQAYVVFGSRDTFASAFDLNALNGRNGFSVNGLKAGDKLGEGASGIGDFNGDGVDDLLLGAPEADANGNESGQSYVIYGRGVSDAGDGDSDDTLTGTPDADKLTAGVGNDRLQAGVGDDELFGGRDLDTLIGGEGADTLAGDSGSDLLQGGGGNDVMTGDSGNDTLAGDAGNDRLAGGTGKDDLDGGSGNDDLFGDSGGDFLVGGPGEDTLAGGTGKDIFGLQINSGADVISDFELDDRLGLFEGLTFAGLRFDESDRNTLIFANQGNELLATLSGIFANAISQASFISV